MLDPFEFILAEKLKMTVAELRSRMSQQEYVQWQAFSVWRNAVMEMESK